MAQVTLQAVVNFEQVDQLQKRIDKLNGTKVTIGVKDFTRQMQEAGKATGEVKNQLSKVVRVFDANGELLSGSEKYQKSIGTTVEIMQKMNKETEQLEETGSRVIRDLTKEQKAAAKAAEEHAKYVAECNREYEKYQQYLASQQKNTPIQNRIDALTGVYRDDPVTRKEFTDLNLSRLTVVIRFVFLTSRAEMLCLFPIPLFAMRKSISIRADASLLSLLLAYCTILNRADYRFYTILT